jgi:HlyD family secretion protein
MKNIFWFLLSLLVFSACKKEAEKTKPTVENITESVYASGVIKSKNQYQVFATVNGLIQKVLVAEGDLIKKGDPLFVIKNETSKLNTENAQLAAQFADINTKNDKLNELKGNIEIAKLKMQNDSVLLVRQRRLWEQQIGAKVELEQRELAYTNSVTAYEAAKFRYNDLVKQLQFAETQSKKNVAISKSLEQDFIVKSQADGRIYSVLKEQGEIVGLQSPLAIAGSANDYLIELQVDENDIVRIQPAQQVLLVLDSYKGQVFEATISKIDILMNERTRTFTVEATFTKPPPALYPNLTAEGNIVIHTKQNALTIPRAYLIDDTFVLLENQEKRKVETGLKDYQKVEIKSGLSANDVLLKPTL